MPPGFPKGKRSKKNTFFSGLDLPSLRYQTTKLRGKGLLRDNPGTARCINAPSLYLLTIWTRFEYWKIITVHSPSIDGNLLNPNSIQQCRYPGNEPVQPYAPLIPSVQCLGPVNHWATCYYPGKVYFLSVFCIFLNYPTCILFNCHSFQNHKI